ncbi:MAG: hypothetical protein E7284_10145 [Lachnospiraceae bacterium]|nr:hypothetical protein [Lachnospiraceae bacterium]
MKSIMHNKRDGTCYLCKKLHMDDSVKVTEEHHVICGTANRRISEKYGLKVYLCLYHHTQGPEAVHFNKTIMQDLKKEAQYAFEKRYPELSFLKVFGRNYIEERQRQQAPKNSNSFVETGNILEETDWLKEVL